MQTHLHVELIRHTYEPNELVALAAKLCYSKADVNSLKEKIEAKDQTAFIEKLSEMHHESPMEHVTFTFAIEGVSRALLAQITRHRLASFSVQSQRYVSYQNGFNYIIPPKIEAMGEDAVREYEWQMAMMHSWYIGWQERLGAAGEQSNEDARFVLPNACETRMIVTMNVRELHHFFAMRMCSRAQWEIRKLAEAMWWQCYEVAPELFATSGPGCLRGACPEGAKSCGKAAEERKIRKKMIEEAQSNG